MSTIKSGTTLTTAFVIEGDTTGDLVFKTGSSAVTAMSISASGVVTFPATTGFDIASANITNLTSGTTSATVLRSASGTITNLLATTATVSASAFFATASGSVGIGTSSPTTKLDISVSSTMGTYGPGTVNLTLRNTNTSETNSGSVQFIGYSGNSTSPYQWALISAEKQTSTGDGNYAGKLHFWTTSGGANGEANSGSYKRLTINGNGNVALQGGTQTADGIGITFPATQSASSNANTLDDYEEGTWTPAFSDAGTPSYSVQYGVYTKIGRIVYCSIAIRATSVSSGSTILLTGLPFTSADTGDTTQRSCWVIANGGHLVGLSDPTGRFRINGSNMQGVKGDATTTFMTATQMTSTGTIEATGDFWYFV